MERNVMFIFSREKDFDKIKGIFMEAFGMEKPIEGNDFYFENNVHSINMSIFIDTMGEKEKQFIDNQKNAVSAYFSQVEDCDEDIKINLIHHIQQSGTLIPLRISSNGSEEYTSEDIETATGIMCEALEQIDGILIVDGGNTALDAEENVILSHKYESDIDSYFPFEYKDASDIFNDCTDRQIARRNENMKYLFDKGIYVCELPLNNDDDNISLRSKEEVVKRTIGTLLVSLYSEALLSPEENMSVDEARDFIGNVMKDLSVNKLEDVLTKNELEYIIDNDSDETTRIQYSWHYENLYVLEWILGLEEWNYPDNICDVGGIVRNLKKFSSVEDMCNNTTMRSKKEILDKADLIYRMDWAAVDARIHEMQGPGHLEHGVVQERHRTLNWMICFDNADWDNVSTPT